MWVARVLWLTLVVGAAWASMVPDVCPANYTVSNGRCWIEKPAKRWQDAANECNDPEDPSFRMADPRTVAENAFLSNLCRTNNAIGPSPWNIWVGPTSYTRAPSPGNVITSGNQWEMSRTNPAARWACVCTPPPNPNTENWCIDVESSRANSIIGLTISPLSSRACVNSATPTTCPTATPAGDTFTRRMCKAPAVPHSIASNTGRGACWLGLSRQSSGSIQWATGTPTAPTVVNFNLFESALGTMAPTAPTPAPTVLSQFSVFRSQGYNPTLSPGSWARPDCGVIWNYRNNGSWVTDHCNGQYPFYCVRDALCRPGYLKATPYTVTSGTSVNVGVCSLCPAGRYRAATDPESVCKPCDAGYFGTGSTPRTNAQCSGVCPAGFFCGQGTGDPSPCLPGSFGNPLPNGQAGPGWTSSATGCSPCTPGKYCPFLNMTTNLPNVLAGFCSSSGATTAQGTGQCTPGYYCPAGSACPGRPCGDGGLPGKPSGSNAYCPAGVVEPLQVPIGHYGSGNTTLTHDSVIACSAGFFCQNGIRVPCPEGSYSNQQIPIAERFECKPCASGYRCPPPASPTTPSSTSPTQEFCADANDPFPAENYCINGTRFRLPANDSTMLTIPVNGPLNQRENAIPCPSDKVCFRGLANDRITWGASCPGGVLSVSVPELWAQQNTNHVINATIFATLIPSEWNLDYRILNQSFFDPPRLATSVIPQCKNGQTLNDGIFDIDPATGRLRVNRFAPSPTNPAGALQYEVCEPLTDIRYTLLVQASLRNKVTTTQANITCTVTVTVEDQNDQPVFSSSVYHRVISESSEENTPAARCSSDLATAGCPNDANPNGDPAVSATDEDDFGQGNLEYSFTGTLTAAQDKLKINSCTGLISQKGGAGNVLRFSDPTIPWFNSQFKRLNYTVRVQDDGNAGAFPVKFTETLVYVYIRNVNDRPVFVTPPSVDIWIPESTPSRRFPPGTLTTPATIQVSDDDPQDVVTLSITRNDASAFEIVGGQLRTTVVGESVIDFESSKKVYSIDIEARDNGSPSLAAVMTVNIRVANMNDPPVIENNLIFYIAESALAGTPVCRDDTGVCAAASAHSIRVTDPDNIPSDVTTFALTINPGGLFQINSTTGQVSLVTSNSLNFENEAISVLSGTGRAYTLQVNASSSGVGVVQQAGLPMIVESSVRNFTVFVVDVNENPVFDTPNNTAFRMVETWPVGTAVSTINILASDPDNADAFLLGVVAPRQQLTFSLSPTSTGATDGGNFFAVTTDPNNNARARIVVRQALDFETAPDCGGGTRCYTLRVRVTDNGGPVQGVAENVYIINLVNVNEAPVFAQASYSVNAAESLAFAPAADLASGPPLIATDVDAGATLTYAVIGGDGVNRFNVADLAPGGGFKVFKMPNVLLNYESKSQFTIQVQVTDTAGGSSAIGKACTPDSGCGGGAFCQNSQCFETCPTYQNATTTILPAQVPRTDVFFCQNLNGVNNLVQITPPFRETAQTSVIVVISDENDAPYIVDKPETVPQPTILTNPTCNLTASLSFSAIGIKDQFPFQSMLVYDEDVPNPGPRAGPFVFSTAGSAGFWTTFQLNNTATGRVRFPRCTSSCPFVVGQIFQGAIQVQDQGGASSTCALFVTILDNNTVPDLGEDFSVPAISEFAEAGTEVKPGYNSSVLLVIDPDVGNIIPDTLTFTSTFSVFFSLTSNDATITLKQPLDYESLYPTHAQTILIKATDSRGASSVVQVTIPVFDENEAPFWTVSSLSVEAFENATALTVLQSLSGLVQDPDIYAANPTWNQTTISIVPGTGCDAGCPVEVSGGNLRIKANATLDFETLPNSWTFNLRVSDGGGLSSDIAATFSLRNVNEAPVFTGTTAIGVPEGSGGQDGVDLLDMSTFVRDPDADDPSSTLSFVITSGNVGNVFQVSNGMLRIAPLAVLDYENIQSYTLQVTVSDSKGLSNSGSFTINVNNVNDVTVSSISVISGPLAASQMFACNGTTSRIRIIGTNFGLLASPGTAAVTVRYRRSVSSGPAAPQFNATGCSVTVNGTTIECDVNGGGSGISLLFDVIITVPSTQIVGDAVLGVPTIISYPVPVLSSVAGANLMSTEGGQTITLTGTCLGTPSDLLSFSLSTSDSFVEMCTLFDSTCRVMPTNCAATSAIGTTVTCTTASLPGLGASTSFRVRSGRQLSNVVVQGGYARPSVTSLSLTTLRTSGVINAPGLVINGTNFGGLGTSPSNARLYYNASGNVVVYNLLGCTVTVAFRQVTCTSTAPGIGRDMRLELEFGLQTNPTSPLLSFESATVTSVATDGNALSPSTGGIFVTLTGTSFGPVCGVPGTSSTSGAVNCPLISTTYSRGSISVATGLPIVYTPQFCAVISQTQIICTTVEGTGRNHTWTVTVGGQPAFVSANAGVTGYSSPVVGAYDGPGSQDASTSGGQYVDIVGAHFGPIGGAPVSAVYGDELNPTEFSALSCAVTVAHIQMRCFTNVGAGDALAWRVTVDGQVSRAQLSDYGPPIINQVTLGGSPATALSDDGGQTVVLTGNNFGPPGVSTFLESVTYGPVISQTLYDVTSRCTVTSHETIQCATLPGLGSNLVWRTRVRGQSSVSASAQSSYAVPTLLSMSANTSRTNGGALIRLRGQALGFCDPNVLVRVAFGSILVDVRNVFRTAAVDPINFATECNPGLPLSYGVDRFLEFAVPEMTGPHQVPVSIQVDSIVFPGSTFRTAQSFVFEYGRPVITDVFAEPGQVIGQIIVTLSGSNFCRSEACCQTYLDGQRYSEFVTVHTHDRITFTTSGPGSAYVSCPGGDTELQVFSSQNPFVYGVVRASDFSRIDSVTFNTEGGDNIYIFSLFATNAATVTVGGRTAVVAAVDTFPCDDTTPEFRPDTIGSVLSILVPGQVCARILAVVPSGQGNQNEITVMVGSLRSRADDFRFEFLSYTPPAITGISATFASTYPTQGDTSALLTVFGTNFGLTGEILFGPTAFHTSRNKIACSPDMPGFSWNHTRVSCFVPAGEGSALDIRVMTGGQLSPVATGGKLRYRRPEITGIAVAGTTDDLADTIGGQTLVITGTNFGRAYNASAIATSPGQLPVITVGATLTCPVQFSSHFEIRCTIPPSDGRNIPIGVIIANEPPASLSPVQLNYGPPVVDFFTPTRGRTDGLDENGDRQVLQIVGKNFGVDTLRVEFGTINGPVLLGERSARENRNTFLPGTNHTSIRVFLPAYFGANLTVTVIVNGQRSNPDGPKFSYEAPFIGNATVGRGGRSLADDNVHIDNQIWTTNGQFGSCTPLKNVDNTTADVRVTIAFKTLLEINSNGQFNRVMRFYSVPNFTTVTNATCQNAATFLGEAVQAGTFEDLGEHPDVGCLRAYRQVTTTATGFPIPQQLVPTGGYGFYLVSERQFLFLGLPTFSSLDEMILTPERADFSFDAPSAMLLVPPPQVLQLIPTSGCYAWESESAYRARVDAAFVLSGSADLPRQCLSPALISLTGGNFGSGLDAPQGALRVFLVDDRGVEYEASTTSSGGNHELVCPESLGCLHSNNLIIFQAPFGSGRGLRVRVVLGNQDNVSLPMIDYEGPTLDEIIPGTLNAGASFMSPLGTETVRVVGDNLGYTTSSLAIFLNGKPCLNSTWISGYSERQGRSSIQCIAPRDVAGLKSVFVCVGAQGKMVLPSNPSDDIAALQYGSSVGAWNTTTAPNITYATMVRAIAVGRCPSGTYGRIGEVCLPCPVGGRCDPGFDKPVPQETFSLISMPADSKRALEGACRTERIDRALLGTFPEMVFYETCEQMVRCVPPEACMSAGVCSEGYEYQLYRCRAKRAENNSTGNSCRVFFDSAVGVYRGVNEDCRLNTEPGRVCSFENPEDCSDCVVKFDGPDPAQAYGVCECTQPQRCALCTATTHYRLNNQCVKCPDNPALVFTLFILAGVACIALAYYLQKRKINLAFISIGVDYFQVLAVLATTNVPWPPVIRAIFTTFSLFLASIDIAAPECLVPNLEFPTKFYLTELLPVVALGILLSIHFGYSMYKVYKVGKQAKMLSHTSRLIGIFVLILYVLYLSLTKKALDVFNCNPLDPDDGYSYTSFSSLSCDGGGLCRCFEAGGLQESLIAPAIVFLIIYTFGFPFYVATIVFRHREQIREDQYLRANRLGDRRETNPRAYDLRKKYQLMYMHFKPRYGYWMLAILARKFGVAFASLMFRGNPSFQLAVILVVLFVSFTMQVSIRPYMSPGEFPVVVKELNDRAKKADEDPDFAPYRDLFRKVSECMKTQAELLRKEKMQRHKMGAGFWEESKQAAREHDRRSVAEKYFFDLNAVEAVLLGSTIIISLAGIMFESGRFQSPRPDIAWQGDMVIVLVFVILFGSLAYYALVFVNEMWPVFFARWCGRCFLKYQNDGITNEEIEKIKDNDIVLDANPLFAATGPVGDKSKSLQKEIEASKEALALAKRQNEELKRLKAELESGGGMTAKNPLALRELMNTGGINEKY